MKMSEMEFRKVPPSAGPIPSIDIGEFETLRLENGLTLIVVENHKLPKVAFQLVVDHDPVIEGPKGGLSEIAGELLARGTQSKTKSQIDDIVDYYGASFHANSSGIYGSVLTKYQKEFLSVFADVLLRPSFPEQEFNKIKFRHQSRLQTIRNEPAEMAYNLVASVNFGQSHPYGDILTMETLENISANDCREYYEKYWQPGCSYLAIVGDINIKDVKANIAPVLEQWSAGDAPKHHYPLSKPPVRRTINFFDRPGSIQSELRMTYPLDFHPANPDRIGASVMNHMLGGGAFSGYLMSNLREDKGYTYGVRSMLNLDPLATEFKISTSVGTEVTVPAIRESLFEMNRIRNEYVDSEHLILAKNSMIGSFARSIENPQTLANRVLNMMRYKLPENFYQTFTEKLDRVNAEEVQEMAVKYVLPEQINIVVVGDLSAMRNDLEKDFPDATLHLFDPFGRFLN